MKRHANAEHYGHFVNSYNRNQRKAADRRRRLVEELDAEELNARAEALEDRLNNRFQALSAALLKQVHHG